MWNFESLKDKYKMDVFILDNTNVVIHSSFIEKTLARTFKNVVRGSQVYWMNGEKVNRLPQMAWIFSRKLVRLRSSVISLRQIIII